LHEIAAVSRHTGWVCR